MKKIVVIGIIAVVLVSVIAPVQGYTLYKEFDPETNTLSIYKDNTFPNPDKLVTEIQLTKTQSDLTTFTEYYTFTSYVNYTFDDLSDFRTRWIKHKGVNSIDYVEWFIERPYNITVNDYGDVEHSQKIPNIISHENVTDTWSCTIDEQCAVGDCDSLEQWNVTRQIPNGTESGIVCFDWYEVITGNPLKIKVYWNETGIIGNHKETRYHWKQFKPHGKTIKTDEVYNLKLVFHKKAETGAFSIQTIPMFRGIEESELTWWNDSWTKKAHVCIDNTGGSALEYYQIPLNITYDTDMQADFDDIRFVNVSSGTEEAYWIEDKDDGNWCLVWFNATYITGGGWSNTTTDMYYGNSTVSSTSDGSATFMHYDDYERGNDGDEVGNDWTETMGTVEISTGQAYKGTRSMKISLASHIKRSLANSNNIAISFRMYKEDACDFRLGHGDGTKRVFVFYDTSEDISYWITAWIDTGSNIVADQWEQIEYRDFDWTAYTFDMYHNDIRIKDGAGMQASSLQDDEVYFIGGDTGNTWIDNFVIRKSATPEPSAVLGAEKFPGDTTFTVSLPTGYTYAFFNLTGVSAASTQTNYAPEGQSDSVPFYNITNTGNVNLDTRLKINTTWSNVVLKYDTDNNPTGATTITTSFVTIQSDLEPSNSVDVWMWMDFDHTAAQDTEKTLEINVTEAE